MQALQLGLAVLGGLGLAALVAYNAWAARKAKLKLADLSAADDGPRLTPLPVEPVFDGGPDTVPQARDEAGAALPEGLDLSPAPRRSEPRLDPLIDIMANLRLDAPISGDYVLAHLPATRRAGTKPLFIEGLNTHSAEWETIQPGQRYGELQAGVQMANRVGAINEIEYSEFVQKVQSFADSVGVTMAEFPDMLEAVARARELDQFASAHDAQLVLRMRAKGSAWSVGYVQQHAARHGFVPGAMPGRMVLPASEDGWPPILSLSFDPQAALAEDPNQSAVRELALAFDVPQTACESQPFMAWRAAGEALAQTLGAAVMDDSGQALHAAAFDAIGAELSRLYQALAQRDLAAGSAVARRLFS